MTNLNKNLKTEKELSLKEKEQEKQQEKQSALRVEGEKNTPQTPPPTTTNDPKGTSTTEDNIDDVRPLIPEEDNPKKKM